MVLASTADGIAAYTAGNYEKAAELLEPEAQNGDVQAQYTLGEMYLNGQGVPLDRDKAMQFFKASADGGYGPAKYKVEVLSK